jgi:hypothetical protein
VIDLFVMSSVVETSGREEDSLFVLGQIPPLRLAFGNPPVGMTTAQAGPWNLPANMQCTRRCILFFFCLWGSAQIVYDAARIMENLIE